MDEWMDGCKMEMDGERPMLDGEISEWGVGWQKRKTREGQGNGITISLGPFGDISLDKQPKKADCDTPAASCKGGE